MLPIKTFGFVRSLHILAVVVPFCGLQLYGQGLDPRIPVGPAARVAARRGLARPAISSPMATPAVAIPQARGTFISFDVPGGFFASQPFPNSTGAPTGITPSGEIAGTYCASTDCSTGTPGFLRDANGAITTFNPPDAPFGFVFAGINPAGVIAGWYFGGFGFVRATDGTITSFTNVSLGSGAGNADINPGGDVAGFSCCGGPFNFYQGFLRTSTGAITTFDVPGDAGGTYPQVINPGGVIAGGWFDANEVLHGFVRDTSGAFTSFDAPAGFGRELPVLGINPSGEITGFYVGSHGFLREPDGTFLTIDPQGSIFTFPASINPAGTIVGQYTDASFNNHGFLRAKDGTFTALDFPGAAGGSLGGTFPMSINNQGAVTGTWSDANGISHGFLFQPH